MNCQLRPSPLLLVLAEDESLVPPLVPDPVGPGMKFSLTILSAPQPEITPGGRRNEWRVALVCFCKTESRPLRPQRLVNLIVKPGSVPEFKSGTVLSGKEGKKVSKPWEVLFQERRELKQERPQLFSQHRGRLE